MQPRAHNLLSYGGAVVALLLACSSPAISAGSPHNRVAIVLWVVHFVRRCAETLWLFEFGGADVPAADCVQEYAYYWGFAAAIAAALASPAAVPASPVQTAVGVAVWCAAEAANHACHRTLARRAATKGAGGRKACVPAGEPFLFSRVACPHYTFEVSSTAGLGALAGRSLRSIGTSAGRAPGTLLSGDLSVYPGELVDRFRCRRQRGLVRVRLRQLRRDRHELLGAAAAREVCCGGLCRLPAPRAHPDCPRAQRPAATGAHGCPG